MDFIVLLCLNVIIISNWSVKGQNNILVFFVKVLSRRIQTQNSESGVSCTQKEK